MQENTKKQNLRGTVKAAFLASLPVLAGYLVLGVGFGVLLHEKGFGLPWAFGSGLFIYAGSMQYVSVDLIGGGASLLTAALTTLSVNARHLFYGVAMAEKYKNAGRKKPYLIFALTDETFSLVCGNDPKTQNADYCFFLSLFNHVYWIAGCSLGAALGSLIRIPLRGLDFALTALFVTVFTEQWFSGGDRAAALLGVTLSAACLLIFGSERFLIPAMLAVALAVTALGFFRGALGKGRKRHG